MKTKLNLLNLELSKFIYDNGFDYEVEFIYDSKGELRKLADYSNDYTKDIPCPTTTIALQFIREKFGLDIFIARIGNITMPKIGYSFMIFKEDKIDPIVGEIPYETFEDAEIAAIKKSQELINELNNVVMGETNEGSSME